MEDYIINRHSVREYDDTPMSGSEVSALSKLIDECNRKYSLSIILVTDEPDAFGKSLMARYGKFRNVRNYLCIAGPDGKDAEIRLGYCGEMIVLKAQELGLNSCWVGLTYNRKKVPVTLKKGDRLHALIALGHGKTSGVPHKSKTPEQVSGDYDNSPEWFKKGVQCALLAPTALNQQKFRFTWDGDNNVRATAGHGFYVNIDLGIAEYHFQLGAENNNIKWI